MGPKRNTPLPKVDMQTYLQAPDRYELRSGQEEGTPSCPYGNAYQWIGFDLEIQDYVRFTKSVFKKLVRQLEEQANQ
ncbi:MAG: hypothetical protein KTR30_14950 [Saprospiraceae bacterium]|nr:hypothetical protein [Saprospiraceae bacterium]